MKLSSNTNILKCSIVKGAIYVVSKDYNSFGGSLFSNDWSNHDSRKYMKRLSCFSVKRDIFVLIKKVPLFGSKTVKS